LPEYKTKPKVYRVDRNPEYFGFGIILHTDRESKQPSGSGQMSKMFYPSLEIVPDSPADVSALKNGQRLVAVNGKYINKDFNTIDELAKAIDDSYYQKGSIDFTVVGPDEWNRIKNDQPVLNKLHDAETEIALGQQAVVPKVVGKIKNIFYCTLFHELWS
jgi:hypothetical protein